MSQDEGLAWQTRVWDSMMPVYADEVDQRFIPVVDQVMVRAGLRPEHRVVDVGTGTGAVALRVARLVSSGEVVGVDISPQMLGIAQRRAIEAELENVTLVEGRAEDLRLESSAFDRVLASLSLMYSLDRAAAAAEAARVLRPGGRFVAAFWAGPEDNDIVKFQMMAGSFAPEPPVTGVGPGSMANGQDFIDQLGAAGIHATLETERPGFCFDSFESAWEVLVGVTTANMDATRKQEAMEAVRDAMWPKDGGPRYFENLTQYAVGERA